jgi:hypothetical protein
MKQTFYNGQPRMTHKVDLYFFCDEYKETEGGEQMPLFVRERFTVSLADSSRLLPFIEKWRGKLTKDQKDRFDLESLIGVGALIQVSHNDTEQGTFANIDSIMKLPKGTNAPPIPADYQRMQDRPPREENGNGNNQRREQQQRQPAGRGVSASSPFDNQDDDLPF